MSDIKRTTCGICGEPLNNVHNCEAVVTIHPGPFGAVRIAALERELAEARAESECGCQINRTGEEVLYTCEQHQYPSTEQEKRAMKDALAAARADNQKATDAEVEAAFRWIVEYYLQAQFTLNYEAVLWAWARREP